jgi:hypothetical protein
VSVQVAAYDRGLALTLRFHCLKERAHLFSPATRRVHYIKVRVSYRQPFPRDFEFHKNADSTTEAPLAALKVVFTSREMKNPRLEEIVPGENRIPVQRRGVLAI